MNTAEQITLRKLSTSFGDMKLLRARYTTQTFARHLHENVPIGVIEDGSLAFYYRGEHVVAPAGSINLANPGEVHTGSAATEAGWMYRMFYFDPEVLRSVASEIAGKPQALPCFLSGVLNDPPLADQLRQLHITLEDPGVPILEKELRLLCTVTAFIQRHAEQSPPLCFAGREHRAVKRARDYIDAHYAEQISLDQLARVAYLSPFHLARVFCDEIGLPPHTYQLQVRIMRAKTLLDQGRPITDVVYELGFFDQSHFHRRFKRITGMTPGQYRKNVQDK